VTGLDDEARRDCVEQFPVGHGAKEIPTILGTAAAGHDPTARRAAADYRAKREATSAAFSTSQKVAAADRRAASAKDSDIHP
jgi:hypothetical protein